jgi:hypothetical protein
MSQKLEPLLHSHITEGLPPSHPRAEDNIFCDGRECQYGPLQLHSANNECLRTWFETGRGNFCWVCFGNQDGDRDADVEFLDEAWAYKPWLAV